MQKNNYKGFSLFNDVEDKELQAFNRGRVLANIAEDNTRENRITPKGASLILNYFAQLKMEERADTQKAFEKQLIKSGFKLQPANVQ